MATLPIDSNIDLLKQEIQNFKIYNLSTAPSTTGWTGINLGWSYYNTTDKVLYIWNGTSFTSAGATTTTDLALGTATATTQPITNTNGTGFTLPVATTSLAGLLSAADKVKVDAAILSTTTDVGSTSWVLNESTLTSNSATKVPTQASVKSYVDNLVLSYGALVYQGDYNASTNSPLLDATPIAGIKKGWTYVVSTAGTFFTEDVQAGDMIIAKQDSPTTLAHWSVINKNIPEILTTLLTGFTTGANSTVASTDSILDAFQKVQGQINALVTSAAGKAVKHTATIGDGSSLTYPITHALGADVIVQVRNASTNAVVLCETVLTNSTTVTLNFNIAPATNSLKVTIIG